MNTQSSQAAVADPPGVAVSDATVDFIPGTELIGRGIYLRPRQPFELKASLLKRPDNPQPDEIYHSPDTKQRYRMPHGIAVNNSPPMPAHQAVNRSIIEESWERLDKEMSFDSNVASSNAPFAVNLNASQTSQLRSKEEAYYALRNSFVPLFTLYVPNEDSMVKINTRDLPEGEFSHANRAKYQKFFEKYGTHYVKRVWVGGSATLAFTILKSTGLSTNDIRMGIKASAVIGSAEANTKLTQAKETLQSNSECTVWGVGGDALQLAALTSLDNDKYNAWLHSVLENPEAIEIEVAGIWTLFEEKEIEDSQPRPSSINLPSEEVAESDPQQRSPAAAQAKSVRGSKASALKEAYLAETTFKPLSTVLLMGRDLLFVQSEKFFSYNLDVQEARRPVDLAVAFPELKENYFERIDAGFSNGTIRFGEELLTMLFLFRDNYCTDLQINVKNGVPEMKFTKAVAIKDRWPGLKFDRVDAALYAGPEQLYFFRNEEYVRFCLPEYNYEALMADSSEAIPATICPGYPQRIKDRWKGVNFDRIDAAVCWDGKAYFFRNEEYIRYDMVNYCADPGYPKKILSNYVQDWDCFD